jgi:CopA family copper-resistance protein
MSYQQINRRKFLEFFGGFGIALTLDQLMSVSAKEVPTIDRLNNPDVINLQIEETELLIGDRLAKAYTVNKSLPGPILRLKEGQTATIKVTNKLQTDTSIHWHGIILPANMDGVPGVSFAGIKPGQTFTYKFPLTQSGTYWYHSHSGMQEQLGHYGALIIDPLEPEPFTYNKDYVILLSDWTFENPHQILANLKKMPTYYNYQRRTIAHLKEDWEWKQMRMDPSDIADVTGATYTYLMNGLTAKNNWTGIFTKGDKIRLRFINGSAMTFFDVQIPGLKMTVVQADGQNVKPVTVDEFRIGVAETYDVIVEPANEEAYTIFAETMDRSGYVRGTLAVQNGLEAPIPPLRKRPLRTMTDMGMDHNNHGSHNNHGNSSTNQTDHSDHSNHHDHSGHQSAENNKLDFKPVPHGKDNHGLGNAAIPALVKNRLNEPGIGLENTGSRVLVYTDLRSLKPQKDQRKPEREIELHLTGNMERYMWSFDGKKYSQEKEIIFYYGERLRLTFVNDTMMEHPIHLHGMWMELDNGAGKYKPRKHTIIVKPAEKMSVEVNVDAKGKWAFHCHLMYHMDVGMFRTVAVLERSGEVS